MPISLWFAIVLAALAVITYLVYRKQRSMVRASEAAIEARQAARRSSSQSRQGVSYDDDDFPGDSSQTVNTEGATVAKVATIVLVCLSLLFLLLASVVQVGTRDIGIVTSFGRPVGHLDNGIHTKKPWDKVSTLDGAIQTDNYVGDKGCTDIRIGNESTACVDNSIRWRINPSASDELFQDFHTMQKIQDSLVTRELKAALNHALSDYNPLDEIQNNNAAAKPDLNAFANTVTKTMQQEIGKQIDVLNVIIPIIRFDSSTQSKINSYQAEVANTRIAQQKEQTAAAQARANAILSKSVSKDPNVLVSKCLDTFDEMVRAKVNVPAGFNCWPGGQSALVVPAAK